MDITEAHIEAIAAKVYERIEANPDAFRGEPGRSAADLTDGEIAALAERLPPIHFRKINRVTGEESEPDVVHLGEGFTFFLTPHGG